MKGRGVSRDRQRGLSSNYRWSSATRVCILFLLLAFVGCESSQVADELGQREALEIVAVLREHGIEATTERGRGARARYAVTVDSAEFGDAVTILHQVGLPAEQKASFSELVAPSGILPSSREVEALRLDRALAAEIEDLLEGHPSIASASVVVRYHSVEGEQKPSVSMVVQHKVDKIVAEQALKGIVLRAVPGIGQDDVVVASAEQVKAGGQKGDESSSRAVALVPFLGVWKVPATEYTGIAGTVIVLLLLVAGLSSLAGYIYGQYSVSRGMDDTARLDTLGSGRVPLERLDQPDDEEDREL